MGKEALVNILFLLNETGWCHRKTIDFCFDGALKAAVAKPVISLLASLVSKLDLP